MNINCPGCNFEYKLDERRIPATGQKMRCPKCSARFRVGRDGAVTDTDSPIVQKGLAGGTIPSMPPVLDNPAPSSQNAEIDDPFGDSSTSAPQKDSWDPFDDGMGAGTNPDTFDDPFGDIGSQGNRTIKGMANLPTPAGAADLPDISASSDLPAPREKIDLSASIDTPDENSELPAPRGFANLPAITEGSDSIDTKKPSFPPGPDADPFGDISISSGDDPFGAVDSGVASPSKPGSSAASTFGDARIDSGDFDLPPSGSDGIDSEFGSVEFGSEFGSTADSPFHSPPNPANLSSAKKTMTGPGGGFAVDAPKTSSLPALGSDDFDIPSPADLASVAPDPPPASARPQPMSSNSGLDDFGNIDLKGDITGSVPTSERSPMGSGAGSVSFGQVDLSGEDTGETGEFDAFPVQEEADDEDDEKTGSRPLDLADAPVRAPLSDDAFGGLSTGGGTATGPDATVDDAQKKGGGAFEGRRKYERQSRKTKILVMLLLLLVGAAGGALHFTPYGVFGVNVLVALLPSATADEVVDNAFSNTMTALDRDTFFDINRGIDNLKLSRSELPQNEDLRLIGVYMHSWHQLRFNVSQKHEKAALSLLGNIKLEASESPYAPIARYARLILQGKAKSVIDSLVAKPNHSSNEAALLAMAFLRQNNAKGALDTVLKSIRKRATPRFKYLEAIAETRLNMNSEAKATLDGLINSAPGHFDARLLRARLLVNEKEKNSKTITELLNPINEADDSHASNEQKAAVHSIMGTLLLQRRKFDGAKKEFFKAKSMNPKDALMLIGNGSLALMGGDLPRAITSFRAALRAEPDNLEARLGVANTLILQDKTGDAKNIIDPIMQSHPNNAVAHYLSGVIAQGVKQFETALSAYSKATELDDTYIEAYVATATVYMETERNKEAMKILDKAAAAVPGSALIKLTLADSHAENEDFASAIVNLNEALELEPDNPIIHFKMAQMYRKMEELEDAQNALDEVARMDPTFPGLSVEQGYLMELSGKIDDALKRYEDALEKNPDDLSAKTRVAAASIYQKNFDRAKELLVEVLNENPDSSDGNFYMGEVFRLEKSAADAIPYLKRATELDPVNPMYFVRYGAALTMVHDLGKAVQQYDKALELDPKMAETYLRIGELKLRAGSVQTAIEKFTKALELDPGIQNARIFIGQAYEEIADLKSAAAYYQKATATFPDNLEGHYRLGKALLQLKGNKAAIKPLKNAVRLAQKQESPPHWLPEALYYLGASQKATGDRSGAIASFRKYLEIAAEDAIDRAEVEASLDDLLY